MPKNDCVARDDTQIVEFGAIDDAAVFRIAQQAYHVVAVDEAVGVEAVAQAAQGRVDDVRVEPIRRVGRYYCKR